MTIDIGNTSMKVGVFEGETLVASLAAPGADPEPVRTLLTFHHVEGISYCCVGKDMAGIAETLKEEGEIPFLELSPETPLPLDVDYSRATLGADRIAAAVGVASDSPVLVVDAGTAVTSDLVAGNKFVGGNIAPGLRLRFRALNDYTCRLPLLEAESPVPILGSDTPSAILAGVEGGLAGETESLWRALGESYPNLKLILTGGDAELLASLLESRGIPFEVDHQAVGRGLVRIFNHNHK